MSNFAVYTNPYYNEVSIYNKTMVEVLPKSIHIPLGLRITLNYNVIMLRSMSMTGRRDKVHI